MIMAVYYHICLQISLKDRCGKQKGEKIAEYIHGVIRDEPNPATGDRCSPTVHVPLHKHAAHRA